MKGYAAALALGAVSLLGACTTPPAADQPSSTSTTDASVSSTTITSLPSTSAGSQSTTSSGQAGVPDTAKANTSQGAEAFTHYFLSEANQAYKAFDEVRVASLALPECVACKNMIDSIASWKAKQYHYVGEYVSPTFMTVSAFPNDNTAKIFVSSRTQESKLLDSNNSVVQTFPPDNSNVSVFLKYGTGSWAVSEIKVAS